ncbi:hypothetical protein ACIQMP_07950 [Streptomyces sp. NPDC091385]|uniref:hypothetical protein n=1 Tax=Streptomyces sp. NPDC091385 TaxID=3365997 RepID=UPI0037FF1858
MTTERVTIITRREWAVPVDPTHGANHTDLVAAWTDATRSYQDDHRMPDESPIPANAISYWPGTDEIVLTYETESAPAFPIDTLARLLAGYDQLTGRVPMPYKHLSPVEAEQYRHQARQLAHISQPTDQ